MATNRLVWPGMELVIDQDHQVVESNTPEPDPEWRFVDAHGHGHFYDTKAREFPTLHWHVLPCTMGHDDDCTSEGFYECLLCEEQIKPGTRMPRPITIAGPVSYCLTVTGEATTTAYAFGPQQFALLQAAIEGAVRGALSDYVVEVSSSPR